MRWRVVIADVASGLLARPLGLSAEDGPTAANSTDVPESVPSTAGPAAAVAMALRNEGVEVIYCGPGATAAQIVQTVLQEDADALGLVHAPESGDPEAVTAFETQVSRLFAERELGDVPIFTELHSDAGRSQFRHQLETFGETGLSSTTGTLNEA